MKINKTGIKMSLWNKKVLAVALFAVSSSAFADFNPFNVFSSSSDNSNNSSQNASANTQSADQNSAAGTTNTPPITTATAANPAPVASPLPKSPYTQMQPLTAPATNGASTQKASATSSQVQINPNAQSFPANRYGAAAAATNATIGLPISGSGSQAAQTQATAGPNNLQSTAAPMPGGSILEVLNLINKSVGTINNNMTTWKNKKDKDEVGAGAQLVATTPEKLKGFLFNQSGFNSLLDMQFVNGEFAASEARSLAQKNSTQSNNNAMFQASALFAPTSISQAQVKEHLSESHYLDFSNNYYRSLVGGLPDQAANLNLTNQVSLFDLINYAVMQVAGQTKIVSADKDSAMSLLQNAVAAPFNPASAGSKETWFDQLQTASTPQLLRTIAILLAENNKIHYLELQNMQTNVILQAGQVTEATAIEQNLVKLTQAQAETNDLLNKILTQMIVQNSKK